MGAAGSEEDRLRAALENAERMILARRRAERDLHVAERALETKTEELQRQRESFQVTLSSIGDAVIGSDVDGKVAFLNPAAEALTGGTSSQASGQPFEQVFLIINEDTRQPADNPVHQVLRQGRIVVLANHTALIGRYGAETAIEGSAAPIRDAGGAVTGAVLVFRDVTARRRAEAALREADRHKDEFLATLAHELRNPLASIRQAVLISRSAHATDSQKRWSHDVITRQVQHMSLLLDELLDVSRLTRGTPPLRKEATEVASLVEGAAELAQAFDAPGALLPEGISLRTEPAPSKGRRVLIADDNQDAANSLAMLLRLEGHEVTTVNDGTRALAALATLKPEFALLDIGMPGLSGYEVAQSIRQRTGSMTLTLIAVTAWGQHGARTRALAAGFDHHFTKPVEPRRLIELLRTPAPESPD